MKKNIMILLLTILAVMLLAACGGAPEAAVMWATNDSYDAAPQAAPMPEYEESIMFDEDYGYDYTDAEFIAASEAAGGCITPVNVPVTEGFAEKIIYSVYADIETMQFDETIDRVYRLLESYGAFIESSNVSGVNYETRFHGWNEYRYAYFSLRVPKNHLNAMTANLESLGNVINLNSSAENITSQFFDTQSRLNSLTVQEERLLDMLSKAEDVPDLIAIEERLGDVRYQIESLTTTINNWQNQVDYSTVTLSIREVEQFTEQTQIHRTYWQQIGDGFMSTIRGVGNFFMNFFKWLIVSAPVLVILAGIAVVAVLIVKRKMHFFKKKSNKVQKTAAVNTGVNADTNTNGNTPPENKE